VSTASRPSTVSVVIPAYNAGAFIGAAIESVLHQTLPALEIIVMDDGSTDDTRDRLRAYEGRVRYFFQKNQGIGAARNAGISQAKGAWIALLDADDVWHPRKLECQWAVIARNPAAGLIGTDSFDITGDDLELAEECSAPTGLEAEPIPLRRLLETAVFCPSSVLIRKSCLEAVGGFFTQVQGSEDMLMWWTLAAGFPVFKLRAALTGYRIHAASISYKYLLMVASKKRALAIASATLPPMRAHWGLRCLARARVFREASWERHNAGDHWIAMADLLISFVNHPGALSSQAGSKLRWDRTKRLCRYGLSAIRKLVSR